MQPRLSGKDDASLPARSLAGGGKKRAVGSSSPSSRSLGLMSFSGLSAPLATSPTTNNHSQIQPGLYTFDPSPTTFAVQMPSPPPRAEEEKRPASPRARSRSRSPRRSRSRSPAPRKPKSYSGLKWKNDKKDSADRDGRRRDDRDDRRRDDRRDFDRRDGRDDRRDDRRGDRYSRDDRDRRGGDRDRRDDRRGDRRDDRDRRDTRDNRDNRDRHPDRRSDKPPRDKKPAPVIASTGEAMIIVTVNDRLGTKTQVPCLPSDPVKVLKAMVAAKIGRPVHEIMLKRQGERPFHDSLSLADYAISNGVQIDLELNTGD
jgi:hypothetical protein